MKRSRINSISSKRRAKLKSSVEGRREACIRANGTWMDGNISLHGGVCLGGACEECGTKQGYGWVGLNVHHKVHLSQGGTDDAENLIMLCRNCHLKYHNISAKDSKPQWSRKEG